MKLNFSKKAVCSFLTITLFFGSSIQAFSMNNAKDILGENFNLAVKSGIITENEDIIQKANEKLIENTKFLKIDTIGNNIIAITLDCYNENIKPDDIDLKAYSSDWYLMNPELNRNINIESSSVSINNEGNTVLLYKISDKIDGNKLKDENKKEEFENFEDAKRIADNYVSWQMSHGGWDKGIELHEERQWDGSESKNAHSGWTTIDGGEIGTIDNNATYSHIIHIAKVYAKTGDEKYKQSVEKGLDFIFKLQYETGGFAQVYPKRGNYSDYVTFNDNAMVNTMRMLESILIKEYPFNNDIISNDYYKKVETSFNKGIDYIVKSQIVSQGKLTAWCQQHDPYTYEPKEGRAYELPSICSSESTAIVRLLISANNRNYRPDVDNAIKYALEWFKESEVKDYRYDKKAADKQCFIPEKGSSIWYRFYEIDTNKGLFSDRDGIAKYDLSLVGDERRTGYTWAGTWPLKLIKVYDEYGYYPGIIEAKFKNGNDDFIRTSNNNLNNNTNTSNTLKKIKKIKNFDIKNIFE